MGNIVIARIQTADEAPQALKRIQVVFTGVDQAHRGLEVVGHVRAGLDADDTAAFFGHGGMNLSLIHICSTLIARTSVAFISFTYFLGCDVLALEDLGLDGQLVAGQTQSLSLIHISWSRPASASTLW